MTCFGKQQVTSLRLCPSQTVWAQVLGPAAADVAGYLWWYLANWLSVWKLTSCGVYFESIHWNLWVSSSLTSWFVSDKGSVHRWRYTCKNQSQSNVLYSLSPRLFLRNTASEVTFPTHCFLGQPLMCCLCVFYWKTGWALLIGVNRSDKEAFTFIQMICEFLQPQSQGLTLCQSCITALEMI